MTGAPKKRVMELIEKYEKQKEGFFPGHWVIFLQRGILILM